MSDSQVGSYQMDKHSVLREFDLLREFVGFWRSVG